MESKWNNESTEQRKQDVEDFKKQLENQLAHVNYDEKREIFKNINSNLDSVFGKEAVFGESLNEGNLKGIIHKVLLAS